MYTVGIMSNQIEGPSRMLTFADDLLTSRQGKDGRVIADSAQVEHNRIKG